MCASEWAYGARRRHAAGLRTIACVALFAFSACSNTATITRRSGPNFEASIEDSDSDSVYVRSGNGALYRVPRNDIVDIDHPGNVHLAIGAALLLWGTLMLVVPARSDAEWSFGPGVYALVLGIPGAILALYGGVTYGSSVLSAHSSKAPEPARLVPLPAAKQAPVPTSVLTSPVQRPASGNGALPTPAPNAPPSETSESSAAPPSGAPTAPTPLAPVPSVPAQPAPFERPASPPQ